MGKRRKRKKKPVAEHAVSIMPHTQNRACTTIRTWDGGDDLADLQAVQDCRLARAVQTENKNTHLLVAPQLGKDGRKDAACTANNNTLNDGVRTRSESSQASQASQARQANKQRVRETNP